MSQYWCNADAHYEAPEDNIVPCPTCGGSGLIDDVIPCLDCDGAGSIERGSHEPWHPEW